MTATQYYILPTALIPNSPRPLLHYTNVLPAVGKDKDGFDRVDPVAGYTLFKKNGWQVAWIYRYGATQPAHFHPTAHECMVVLSGRATIRFGAGDLSDDLGNNTHGDAWENGNSATPTTPDAPRGPAVIPGGSPGVFVVPRGGVTLDAKAGDVFVIPAGVAHKTHNTRPAAAFQLLSPGLGHGFGVGESEMPSTLASIPLSGFTMLGAYVSTSWDSAVRGGDFEASWAVPRPASDPVFGTAPDGSKGSKDEDALEASIVRALRSSYRLNQVELHALDPNYALVPWCKERGIAVILKSATPSRREANIRLVALVPAEMASIDNAHKILGRRRLTDESVNLGVVVDGKRTVLGWSNNLY